MSFQCLHCQKGEPLYKCPTCGAMAHIDKKQKLIVLHLPPLRVPKTITAFQPPVSECFPRHFDCELAKPIHQIDLRKLVKVEVKPKK